ncbi:Na+/H+ antiporter NhaA [uncultured Propionibacterium sp.]|uniref:Na+/H+ antiporter NhaA n=1 Tax=uncultured Propionibacterium sp. TaxID=218066 RepID=UPI00292CBF44|nr:Na+/H+ antiporter NhaA [uncultured Propionibacterium sp.]
MTKTASQPARRARRINPDNFHLGEVLRANTTGGVLMLIATVIALVWAFVGEHGYESFVEYPIGPYTVAEWASDGLLTVFFFISGLELKREFTEGSLRRPADAMVPIIAAACGMAGPALVFIVINTAEGGAIHGWAVPVATDIAFALAVLAVAGKHLPPALRAFMLTLAIADDLGGIIVIAVVFSTDLSFAWLAGAVACMLAWWILQRRRVDNGWIYLPIFLVCWYCMLHSGVHATIAGVGLGLLTRNTPEALNEPLDRWQHALDPWSAGFVVPIFALTNAGVHVDGQLFVSLWTDPVPLGIIAGLVVGKFIGIFAGSWLTVHLSRARLGDGLTWGDMLAAAELGGVGLTVSLLIAHLSFIDDPGVYDEAKTGVLIGSFISAVIAVVLLQWRTAVHKRMRREKALAAERARQQAAVTAPAAGVPST